MVEVGCGIGAIEAGLTELLVCCKLVSRSSFSFEKFAVENGAGGRNVQSTQTLGIGVWIELVSVVFCQFDEGKYMGILRREVCGESSLMRKPYRLLCFTFPLHSKVTAA